MAWLVVCAGIGIGLALLAWGRKRSLFRIEEAVPLRSVSTLEAGRFKVRGHIVAMGTTKSAIDGLPCVFVERAEYETAMGSLVLREVVHGTAAHPFFVDDGTGRVRIDPSRAAVEAVTLFEDDGLLAERRLRSGEEIEVVATFAPCASEDEGGPYREGLTGFEATSDACGPPRITYRTQPNMIAASDDVIAFVSGAALVLVLASLSIGFISVL